MLGTGLPKGWHPILGVCVRKPQIKVVHWLYNRIRSQWFTQNLWRGVKALKAASAFLSYLLSWLNLYQQVLRITGLWGPKSRRVQYLSSHGVPILVDKLLSNPSLTPFNSGLQHRIPTKTREHLAEDSLHLTTDDSWARFWRFSVCEWGSGGQI